eukprot:6027980-Prymnesium_polylepis.1
MDEVLRRKEKQLAQGQRNAGLPPTAITQWPMFGRLSDDIDEVRGRPAGLVFAGPTPTESQPQSQPQENGWATLPGVESQREENEWDVLPGVSLSRQASRRPSLAAPEGGANPSPTPDKSAPQEAHNFCNIFLP